MTQHCPHHPDANPGTWTPQSGRDSGKTFVTCTKFLGQGALGANPKGYCTWKELLQNGPQPAQEARSAPVVSAEPSGAYLRFLWASAALQAASMAPGSPEDVTARAEFYGDWLKRKVTLTPKPAPPPPPEPVAVPDEDSLPF
jgi:hypothetical protein